MVESCPLNEQSLAESCSAVYRLEKLELHLWPEAGGAVQIDALYASLFVGRCWWRTKRCSQQKGANISKQWRH
jgi:hypothetical protein